MVMAPSGTMTTLGLCGWSLTLSAAAWASKHEKRHGGYTLGSNGLWVHHHTSYLKLQWFPFGVYHHFWANPQLTLVFWPRYPKHRNHILTFDRSWANCGPKFCGGQMSQLSTHPQVAIGYNGSKWEDLAAEAKAWKKDLPVLGPNWVPSKWENPENTGHYTSQWFHSPLTIETHHSQKVS